MARGNDERHNPNRRPIVWRSSDGQSSDESGLGKMIAEMIKKSVYDAEFNDIVGITNDIVARPDEEQNNG